MNRTIAGALLLLLMLSSCVSPKPSPVAEPPAVRSHEAASRGDLSALAAAYATAADRVRAYEAEPRCADSGPVACFDPVKGRKVAAMMHDARSALSVARRSRAAMRLAHQRVRALVRWQAGEGDQSSP